MRTNTDKKVNLIRRNNQEKVTAYHDSVMLHLQKGENGIIPEVGEQFRPEYNSLSKILTIHSGMAVIYGRQFEVVETDQKKINFSGLENGQKITIWAEIDLRDPTEGTAVIKTQKVHPVEDFFKPLVGDNLIKTPNGIARMELFRITYNHDNKGENSTLNIVNRFKVLSNDWIANASFATNAVDSDKVGGNKLTNDADVLKVQMRGSTATEIIERKRCIFEDDTIVGDRGTKGLFIGKDEEAKLIPLKENEVVNDGDTLEFLYIPQYIKTEEGGVGNHWKTARCVFSGDAGQLLSLVCDNTQNNVTVSMDVFHININKEFAHAVGFIVKTGEFNKVDRDDGKNKDRKNMIIRKIYKIIGGDAI